MPASDERESLAVASDAAYRRLERAVVRFFGERKYSPDQPRAPAGTHEGGRWTGAGGASGSASRGGVAPKLPKPGPGLALAAARALIVNPEAAAAAGVAAAPLAVGAIGVSRAAGLYDHYTTGRGITPFLHIPYDEPPLTSGEYTLGHASELDKQKEHISKVCAMKYDDDIRRCGRESDLGRTPKEQKRIFAVCAASASERQGECIAAGGLDGIRTPLFRVTASPRVRSKKLSKRGLR